MAPTEKAAESSKANEAGESSQEVRYRGVQKRHRRYRAEIRHPIKKTNVSLGTFDAAELAARAYDEATRAFQGNKAKTNFPAPDEFGNSMNLVPKTDAGNKRRNDGEMKVRHRPSRMRTAESSSQERLSAPAAVNQNLAALNGGTSITGLI